MSLRYGNKIGPLQTRKTTFFSKDRFDRNRIKTPGASSPDSASSWTRPSEWLAMPSFAANEQKIALLIPVRPEGSNYVSFTVAGAYTVNWGDGSTENFASGVRCQKEYLFTDPDLSGTLNVDGAKMAIAVITPQAGQNITSVNFNQKFVDATLGAIPDVSPILEIAASIPFATSVGLGSVTASAVFCKSLVSFRGLDLSGLTSFLSLFENCISLANVEIGSVSPSLNSTSQMFRGCISLVSVSAFDTSSVTNMSQMFGGCRSITTIPHFNTVAVTDMSSMFYSTSSLVGCPSLTAVPLLNTASVTNMSGMFNGCRILKGVPLFNTVSVTDMSSMFSNCVCLVSLPFFDTSSVMNMSNMFNNCTALESVPLFNTVSVTNMLSMFSVCRSLIDVPLFNTSSVTNMSSMFNSCTSLTEVPMFNTAAVESMASMFSGCSALTSVPSFNMGGVLNMAAMFNNCTSLEIVPLFNISTVSTLNTSSMFSGCSTLTSVPLFNTVSVTNMSSMFNGCTCLTDVPLFNTVSVTNMNGMFGLCPSLTSVPPFNTEFVINMNSMFSSCTALTDVPLFNTARVTNMGNMFSNCVSLKSVPLFNTASVTNMGGMFGSCASLTSVPLFNTVSVTDMNSMFTGCTSLTSVPSFNTAAVQNMSTMFNNCPVLRSVNFSQTGAGTLTGKFSSAFVTCSSLSRCRLGLAEYSLNFTNCNLSRSSIEEVFVEADTIGAASQIITITNNPGARAPAVIATSSAVGNGATVIPLTTTIGLEIGMQFTATVSPINVGRPVTFTDAGDIVALAAPAVGAAHGLQNGDMISFSTTTAGIVANRIYYVVGAATNTFQIAATLGGPAINITSGSSNVRYSSTITAIGPGLQVTISRPTPALTSGASLSFRQLQTAIAIHKGWAVTG